MKLTITKNPAVYEATGILLKRGGDYQTHALITPDALYATDSKSLFKVELETDMYAPGVYEVIKRTKSEVVLLSTELTPEDTFPGPILDDSIFNTKGTIELALPETDDPDVFFCSIAHATLGYMRYKQILAFFNASSADTTLHYQEGGKAMIHLSNGALTAAIMPLM